MNVDLAAGLIVALVASTPAPATGRSPEGMIMSQDNRPPRSSSRAMAPRVDPVLHEGVRYEPVSDPAALGLEPLHVYVSATDVQSGRRLWVTRVVEVSLDPRRETDVQQVYLAELTLDARAGRLLARDERGRSYALDLATGKLAAR